MSAIAAELSITARWMLPMTVRGEVLEEHSLIVRDGRILDVLPAAEARRKYRAGAALERPTHVLMPGLVNADTQAAASLLHGFGAPGARGARVPRSVRLARGHAGTLCMRDGALLSIARMLKGGVTCFADRSPNPAQTAAAAAEQGIRAAIGMPVADTTDSADSADSAGATGAPAQGAAESLTRALALRDEWKGHPGIVTFFAPRDAARLSDATFGRLAVIAGELDAGVCLDLHESAAAVADSLARHGVRPIERLDAFGLLTPDFTAVHMTHLDASDIDRAQRSGIAACLCPESDFDGAHAAALAAAGLRLALGSGAAGEESLWSAVRLVPLLARRNAGAPDRPATDRPATDRVANDWPAPWDVLAMATRGGAGALGLDAEIGTLGIGKWADLCCIDLDAPALQPTHEPAAPLVFRGSRDMVTDVWVAGRQLLAGSRFTRLDWPATAARAAAWVGRIHDEEAESW